MYQITSPSSFDEALKERLSLFIKKVAPDVVISSYEEWGGTEITGTTLMVQWEDAHPGGIQNDGRYQHSQMLTAHCIVPRAHPNAQLLAMDMAYEVERLLFHRRLWMDEKTLLIDPEVVGIPDIQLNGDTSFLIGLAGVAARGVQWQQPLNFGASLVEPSEAIRWGYSIQEIGDA